MDDSSSQPDPLPAAPESPAAPAEAQAPADAPDAATAPDAPAAPVEAATPLAGLRERIGSLGDRDAARQMKARGNVAPAPGGEDDPSGTARKKSYPPPRTKTQLPAELEQEVEAALGGMSLDAMLSSGADEEELAPETRIKGKVVSVHREDVFVDVGRRHQGIVPLKQFEEPPEPGSELELVVNRFQEEDGIYELLLPGAAADVGDWSEVEEGLVVEATVTGHNKGGLECQVGSLRGFIPASQVDRYRIEDFSTLVGDKFACVVTECNPDRRNLVLSRRAVLEREQAAAQEKLWEELSEGQNREGVVRSLQNFGAFVDLGGVDGLIHISRLSWGRIGHPSEVLEVGQKVRVRVEKLDRETRRVGLSYRDLADNPWESAAGRYTIKSTVRGTVSRVADFGAFVKLEPGIEGLVHISEISHKRVFRVTDVVSEGEEVEAVVLSVDPEAQRIGLSMKSLEARPEPTGDKRKRDEDHEIPVSEIPKHKGPLKGGVDRPSGGEQFGLKW